MKKEKVDLSKSELRLFELMPRAGVRISTEALVELTYPKPKSRPMNARVIVGGRMRTIMAKFEYNGDRCKLKKSERRGPNPIEYWIEK